jgi:hypothetical protein
VGIATLDFVIWARSIKFIIINNMYADHLQVHTASRSGIIIIQAVWRVHPMSRRCWWFARLLHPRRREDLPVFSSQPRGILGRVLGKRITIWLAKTDRSLEITRDYLTRSHVKASKLKQEISSPDSQKRRSIRWKGKEK